MVALSFFDFSVPGDGLLCLCFHPCFPKFLGELGGFLSKPQHAAYLGPGGQTGFANSYS